jgi:hypothetical protein
VRRDLMGQRFKKFKPVNRCAPFKALNGLDSIGIKDSRPLFSPPTTKRTPRVTLAGSYWVPVRAGPRLRDPASDA